jgi:DNA-binding MarR family transcriptional regulator
LEADQLVTRTGERPGRRGQQLELTAAGRQALDAAGRSIRTLLYRQLIDWTDHDIAAFARLIARFNAAAPGPFAPAPSTSTGRR